MIQNFYFTFFLFLLLQRNFFPLWLRHQTSAFYRAPRKRNAGAHNKGKNSFCQPVEMLKSNTVNNSTGCTKE